MRIVVAVVVLLILIVLTVLNLMNLLVALLILILPRILLLILHMLIVLLVILHAFSSMILHALAVTASLIPAAAAFTVARSRWLVVTRSTRIPVPCITTLTGLFFHLARVTTLNRPRLTARVHQLSPLLQRPQVSLIIPSLLLLKLVLDLATIRYRTTIVFTSFGVMTAQHDKLSTKCTTPGSLFTLPRVMYKFSHSLTVRDFTISVSTSRSVFQGFDVFVPVLFSLVDRVLRLEFVAT